MRVALRVLISHWRRHPLQLLTLVGGLVLATALWSGVQALNAQARASYAASAAVLGQDSLDRLVPAPGARITWDEVTELRRAGWLVSPVVEGRARIGDLRVQVLGIDPLTTPPRAGLAAFADGLVTIEAFLTAPGVWLVAPEDVARFAPGAPVLASADVPRGTLITDLAQARELLVVAGFDHLLVAQAQPLGIPPLEEVTALQRITPEDTSDIAGLTDSFHLNLTAFGLLSFAVGLFIVQSAIGLAVHQREGSVRTLRAIGMAPGRVLGAFAVELGLIALVAGALGLAAGYALAGLLMPGVSDTLQGLYGARASLEMQFDPVWAVAGLAMTLGGTALAGARAGWRLVRLPLLARAGSDRATRDVGRMARWQAGAGALLVLVAALLSVLAESLIAGFACLAALLLGAALMLPWLLMALLGLARRIVSPGLPRWAVADTEAQVPGLSLALMALLLALAANVGVGTMVGSFRTTFIGWLDQRLAAEVYVTARSGEEAQELRGWLSAREDVTAVLPIWSVDLPLLGVPGVAYGVVPHATYRDHWPLVAAEADVWTRFEAGAGILVNEQLFRRNALALGQEIAVTGAWRAEVLGVYSDYGNTRPQIMGLSDLVAAHVVQPEVLRFAVRVAPETSAELVEALRAGFALPPPNVVDQGQVKAFSLDVFERTFLITGALNVLTLGVAGFALWTSLLTLSDLRLPHLAPVWSMGLPSRALALFEGARTLALAVMVWALSIPLGLMLAWVLLTIVNVQAFGWRLPMSVFPIDWLVLGASAVVATLVAAAWPALMLMRQGPFRLLKVAAADA
ncbi:FtsX-like permease family protein [Pseudaestuariivita sp.]|uniref:FtsX-like permease family protein n=1 Tax=Pseudaestuariivita sp. TaxID=2211669 RepID=UPI0040586F48